MSAPAAKPAAKGGHTFRKFKDGDHEWKSLQERIFAGDESDKCPTYVHKTPPCQASCPSGEDIRGWLNIVRGEVTYPGVAEAFGLPCRNAAEIL